MLAKKLTASLAVLVAAAAVSAPAFADRDHYRGHGHGYGHSYGHGYGQGYGHGRRVVVHQPHYVVHRPAVVHHYYRPAPRPVYVVERPHYNGAALLVGAVLGAAIVHHAVTGY